jgi:hypothetical protein
MRNRCRIAVMVAALCPAALGCHTVAHLVPPPPPPVLPEVDRQLAPPDVSQVTADAAPARPPTADRYHRLTAEECRLLACSRSAAAAVIDAAAADTVDRGLLEFLDQTPADRLRRTTAAHLSHEARLRTAAAALELYYRLLEAELTADVLARSIAEVDELVRAGRVMIEKGFPESAEHLQLRKQQVELRAEHARLHHGIRRLNVELKALLRIEPTTPGLLLPADQIQVVPEPLDPEHAVRVGLASRPDLRVLRDLIAGLNHRTVEAVRAAVAGLLPPLGAVHKASRVLAPGLRVLIPALAEPDEVSLRRQLTAGLDARERDAVREIRAAVDEWHTQRELVAIARDRQRLAAERARELGVRRAKGASVEAEYRQAVLDQIKADREVIQEAVKWKLADVKARQAMGLLCGDVAGGCR